MLTAVLELDVDSVGSGRSGADLQPRGIAFVWESVVKNGRNPEASLG